MRNASLSEFLFDVYFHLLDFRQCQGREMYDMSTKQVVFSIQRPGVGVMDCANLGIL